MGVVSGDGLRDWENILNTGEMMTWEVIETSPVFGEPTWLESREENTSTLFKNTASLYKVFTYSE